MKSVFTACGVILACAPLLLAYGPQGSIPEPGSFVLLGTGVAALGFAIWRRSRART